MIIYPDIEILDRRLANYRQGSSQEFVYYERSPLEAALEFERQGAQWLHVADLDQVYDNETDNTASILEIIDKVNIPVQVVGGIRTMHDVNWWFDQGAARIVLGTVGLTDHSLVVEASSRYPGAIVVSIDTQDDHVMIDGWRQKTSFNAVDLALDLQRTGIAAVIHTDIDRFVGNPEGNLALTTELGRQLSIPVISSGTVDTADDLARLTYLHNIGGVILGRALLNERLDLGTALRLAAQSANSESSDELPRVVAPSVAHRGVRVYLSAYSSTQPARWWNSQLRAAITEDNPSIEVSIPQEDLEIEYEQEQEQPEPGSEQSRYLEALQQADVVVVGLDGIENEAWSGFECGFAKACGKPLIGLESTTADGGAPTRGSASLVHACDEVIHYEQYEDVKHTIDCLGKAVSNRLLYPDSQDGLTSHERDQSVLTNPSELRKQRAAW